MNIVIGSGPAGIACACALLDKGKEVLLIDAGLDLETEQKELLARIKDGSSPRALEGLKAAHLVQKITSKGLLNKLVYGSDFPYRDTRENLGFEKMGTGLEPSLAVGGFSNVWGAAALPYLDKDMGDWPIAISDLTAHYEAIIQRTGLSATNDELLDLFPLYTGVLNHLDASSQARDLLQGLNRLRPSLRQDGILHGNSRLMVGPSQSNKQPCVYCGQCIHGCPYGCIYNSGDHLAVLLKSYAPRLKYRSNLIVTTIEENGANVIVRGFDRISKAPVAIEGERGFLAAGVVASTRIMLKSLSVYNQPVSVKDSQYFLFPLLSLKGNRRAVEAAAYTLSQIFMEIQDSDISPYTVHLQVYTYNDIITKTLDKKFQMLPSMLRQIVVGQLEQRMIIVQGFLHSEHSGTVNLTLHRDPVTLEEKFTAEGVPNFAAKKLIKKILRKLGKHLFKLGLFPIAPTLEFCQPGRGFHSGGSFPMRAEPGPLESDRYGRIGDASRIHVVDASIFPSIPATTITLTAMANAHRIGSGEY